MTGMMLMGFSICNAAGRRERAGCRRVRLGARDAGFFEGCVDFPGLDLSLGGLRLEEGLLSRTRARGIWLLTSMKRTSLRLAMKPTRSKSMVAPTTLLIQNWRGCPCVMSERTV